MGTSNKKELTFCIVASLVMTALMAIVSNSSIGFSSQNLAQATTGIRALMLMLMDYKAIAYVGIPMGFLLFGLSKLLNLDIKE